MAGFIIFWHRSNIQRMKLGNEDRKTNLMFLRRKGHVTDDG